MCDGLSNTCAITAQLSLVADPDLIFGDAVLVSQQSMVVVLASSCWGTSTPIHCKTHACTVANAVAELALDRCSTALSGVCGRASPNISVPRVLQETVFDDFFANLTNVLQLPASSLSVDSLQLGGSRKRRRALQGASSPAPAPSGPAGKTCQGR